MNWVKAAAFAALMAGMAAPAHAQRRVERAKRAPGFVNVEAALRMREQLKLTDAQVAQLETLRKEIVAQRQKEAQEMIDLESRIAAGNVERDEMRKYFESRREAMTSYVQNRKERLDKILTEEQRGQLGRAKFNRTDGRGRFEPGMRGRRDLGPRLREPLRRPRREME
jgi:Spy/CpxP family protein refolding chaperone